MTRTEHITGKSRHSDALRKAFNSLARRRPCLIVGEAGVGKSHFATELGKLDTAFTVISPARLTEEEFEARLTECRVGTLILDELGCGQLPSAAAGPVSSPIAGTPFAYVVTFSASPGSCREETSLSTSC